MQSALAFFAVRRQRSLRMAAMFGLAALAAMMLSMGPAVASARPTYLDANQPVKARVNDLLERMTLPEKVGQMVQINAAFPLTQSWEQSVLGDNHTGSILSGGGDAPNPNTPEAWATATNTLQKFAKDYADANRRPWIPIIYGFDAVHGVNNVAGAPIFPHDIGLGATADTSLVRTLESSTARSSKALGIDWTFAPVLEVSRDVRYGRYYESFGEDPALNTALGSAAVKGFQGDDPSSPVIAATAKHFVGYSAPIAGHDRTMSEIPLRYLQETFLPPFVGAVDAGAQTVMAQSGSVNGIPVHASHYLLTDVLRNQMHFNGVVVSDWNDVWALYNTYHLASDYTGAIRLAVNAGVDMTMEPYNATNFTSRLISLVQSGGVSMSRIDQAVSRILNLKFKLGIFDHPYVDAGQANAIVNANATSLDLARRAADESMTLLKNGASGQPVLPLSKSSSIVVTGPSADSITNQMGGWTIGWQGVAGGGQACCAGPSDQIPPATTVLQGIKQAVGSTNVTYVPGSNASAAAAATQNAGAAVVVVGEPPYAEGPGDTESDQLQADQTQLVQAVAATGKPTIVVVIAGRPMIMNEAISAAGAVLMGYLPGTAAGQGVADVLFGDYNPSGRLPVSWPKNIGDEPMFYQYLPGTNGGGDGTNGFGFGPGSGYDPAFAFGSGLSYTTFSYGNLTVSGDRETIHATVDVTNTGSRTGDDIVEAFAAQPVSAVLVPPRRLAGFSRVHLTPGQTIKVDVSFPSSRLAVVPGDVDGSGPLTVEPGTYQLIVDSQKAIFTIS